MGQGNYACKKCGVVVTDPRNEKLEKDLDIIIGSAPFLSAKEIARFIDRSYHGVYRLCHRHKIELYRRESGGRKNIKKFKPRIAVFGTIQLMPGD